MNRKPARADAAPSSPGGATPRSLLLLMAIVWVAGCALRFYHLGQPELWGDEILFLRMCDPASRVMDVVKTHLQSFGYIGHLPATGVLFHLGMRGQGIASLPEITPWAARLPAAILGSLSLLALMCWIWRLGRSWFMTAMAGALGAFSFIHIWHSQEAYHYVGQILFGILVLLCWTELTRAAGPGKSLALWLGYAVSLFMLAFTHPAGSALMLPLSICSVAFALRHRRRWRWHLMVAALGLAMCALILLAAGKPRPPGPGIEILRFPFWLVIPDLLENFVFGPGNLRLLAAIGVLAGGMISIVRKKDGVTISCLVLIPLIFLAVHVGGRSNPYFPRYFLLLWPVLMLVAAAGLEAAVLRLPGKWRVTGAVGLALLMAANVAPGVRLLYRLQSRSECFNQVARYLEQQVEPGSLCLWDGGHALRFLPGFVAPRRPFLYGALPDPSAEAFAGGAVETQLANLCRAFPAVAYLEWGGLRGPYARRVVPHPDQIAGVNARIAALFPHHETIRDPAHEIFYKSGWYPGVPRFCSDYDQRVMDNIEHTPRIFYTTAASSGSLAAPIFDPGAWQLMFSQDHQPLLLGAPQAAVLLEKNSDSIIARGAHAALQLIAFQPGEFTLLANGAVIRQVHIEQAGMQGVVCVPWRGERMVIEVRFRGSPGQVRPDMPAYALTGIAVRQGLPPSSPQADARHEAPTTVVCR